MDKFAGVGLKNIFVIWLVCMMLTLCAKIILVKYPIDGLSQVVITSA